jgi:hypothetical protein
MKDICKQDTDKVLLLEGKNDCHVVMPSLEGRWASIKGK